jgi:hypothetical protein
MMKCITSMVALVALTVLGFMSSASAQFTQPLTGATTRTDNAKMSDIISVMDFIPQSEYAAIRAGTSTTDVTSYFQAAVDSFSSGSPVLITVLTGQYRLDTNVSANGRFVSWIVDAGVTITGGGTLPLSNATVNFTGGLSAKGPFYVLTRGSVSVPDTTQNPVAAWTKVANSSTTSGVNQTIYAGTTKTAGGVNTRATAGFFSAVNAAGGGYVEGALGESAITVNGGSAYGALGTAGVAENITYSYLIGVEGSLVQQSGFDAPTLGSFDNTKIAAAVNATNGFPGTAARKSDAGFIANGFSAAPFQTGFLAAPGSVADTAFGNLATVNYGLNLLHGTHNTAAIAIKNNETITFNNVAGTRTAKILHGTGNFTQFVGSEPAAAWLWVNSDAEAAFGVNTVDNPTGHIEINASSVGQPNISAVGSATNLDVLFEPKGSGVTRSSKSIAINGSSSGSTTLAVPSAASGTLILPSATDTLVGRATTDTLTNKAISGSTNTLTNIPVSTAISGLGPGVTTFLATPSSANLAAAVTDETGSGSLVFATNGSFTPTITFNGSSTGVNYNSGQTAGTYESTGRTVTARFRMVLSSKGSLSGLAKVAGFPVAFANNVANNGSNGICTVENGSSLEGTVMLLPTIGGSDAYLATQGATGRTFLTNAAITNTSELNCQIAYAR